MYRIVLSSFPQRLHLLFLAFLFPLFSVAIKIKLFTRFSFLHGNCARVMIHSFDLSSEVSIKLFPSHFNFPRFVSWSSVQCCFIVANVCCRYPSLSLSCVFCHYYSIRLPTSSLLLILLFSSPAFEVSLLINLRNCSGMYYFNFTAAFSLLIF